ncbi:Os05g0320600 [Oryza sativa Japonica Group]|uniref:Os05g0320600 protein n=1 Tax=Oryza sativa subsp. japonica TaxID=39947 RepID=A0A0P0WKQ6_ORYSJ|nr:Os05g0320600 [Oryza sativa Japonica Group]
MPGSARARLGARTVRTELKRGGSKAGGLNRKPALFEEAVVDAAMEAKGKKRKREVEVSHPALERAVVPTNSALPIHRSALESGEDSSESVTSDAGTAKPPAKDVVHVANALCTVCTKSPKAVIEFVRRVSPSTVSRSIDWDLVNEDKSSKMSESRGRWTDFELHVFLESCLEEMAAFNITSNSPKPKAWENLVKKMKNKCKKKMTKAQLEYIWGQCKKQYQLWVKKGVIAFRNDPLKHIDLHHAVFSTRTVVGNHSAVAGADQGPPQQPVEWQPIDIDELTAAYTPPPPAPSTYGQSNGSKGKRKASGETSGSSNKRTRSSDWGDALDRLSVLCMASMESHAKQMDAWKASSPDGCMELEEKDGLRPGSEVWFMAARLLRDASNGHCFMFARLTDPDDRLRYILTSGNGFSGASGGSN